MNSFERFKKWGLGYSGCDGGDMGSPERRSIWVCGIEWGGGHTPEELNKNIDDDVETPPVGYDDWTENTAYIFNWQVMKLLSAINGEPASKYKHFSEANQPFVKGHHGYFKMNVYPIGFKDTSHDRWHTKFASITGFDQKSEYLKWCAENRLPRIRQWASKCKPRLVICLGKTYKDHFGAAFLDGQVDFHVESIDDRELAWSFNSDGTLVTVLPFMVNRNGLVKNVSIQKFGNRIAQLLTR